MKKQYTVIEEYCDFVFDCIEYKCHYVGDDPKAAVAAAHKACAKASKYSEIRVEVRCKKH